MSRRPDLPAAGAPSRRWRAQGLSSAGLALVLLLAMIATQRSAPEPPAPPATAAPQQQRVAQPPVAAAPLRDRRAVVAPRAVAPTRRSAVRPPARTVRRQAPATARPAPTAAPLDVHAPMERSYLPDAHAEGVCPAGTQSSSLGLSCRGAQVRRLSGASRGHLVQFQVCPTTTGRFDLRFAGEAEVAMTVRDRRGRAVWTWRPDRPFADDPHVLVSEVGACWLWQTPWRQVDDDGQALRPGRFSLEVDFLEVDDADTYVARF